MGKDGADLIPRQGKKTIHQRLADIWREDYLDAPYRLGEMSRKYGYDCLSSILTLLWALDCDIPPFFAPHAQYLAGRQVRRAGDLDITNYADNYDLEMLPVWFATLGEEINPRFRQAGDLILCHLEGGQWMISMYMGNEICTLVNGETMRVGACPFRLLQPWVMEMRRCLP